MSNDKKRGAGAGAGEVMLELAKVDLGETQGVVGSGTPACRLWHRLSGLVSYFDTRQPDSERITELEAEVERLKTEVFDAGGERDAARLVIKRMADERATGAEPPRYCATCRWQAKNLRCTNPLGAACGQERKYWEPKENN